jgi:hypothetical protein
MKYKQFKLCPLCNESINIEDNGLYIHLETYHSKEEFINRLLK